MSNVFVVFCEGALVEEELKSLTGSQLVLLVLAVDAGLATADLGLLLDVLPALDEAGGAGTSLSGPNLSGSGLDEGS